MAKQVAEHVQRWRENHHAALATLATNGKSGKQLWQALTRIERDAHSYAERLCSGRFVEMTEAQQDRTERDILERVTKVFGALPVGFQLNRDPRGYALKLDPDAGAVIPSGMHKDWGGYGILAAVIE